MLRPELQTLVAAGATCHIRGRVDTYQREPHHGTVRVCLANCTVRPVRHLQDLTELDPNTIRTDHLWVRLPMECIDGRPAEPGVCSVAREATVVPPTRLLDTISLVGRLGYYTDSRGQLGMGVRQVLPIYHAWSLVAMLAEAYSRWDRYRDAQAHDEALSLLAMVQQVLRPAKPGQVHIDTPRGPALTLLQEGITVELVRSRAARLQGRIDASFAAERRARAGHQRARAAARANGRQPVPLQLPQRPPLGLPTALDRAQDAAAINGYIRAQRQQHQVVPPATPARGIGRGFAA